MGWRRRKKRSAVVPREDAAYLSSIKAAHTAESLPHATWALYLMLAAVVCAITWAALSRVDEITKAEGRVIPDGREQVIASLEGGILRALMVQEGQQVEVGQELAQLDPTRFEAQQNEGQIKRVAVQATVARLTAEARGGEPRFPKEVLAVPRLVQAEMEAFEARRRLLQEAVGTTRRSMELLLRELKVAESMSSAGLMSEVEVMRVRRQVNDLQMQVSERTNRFRQDASTELARAQSELAQLDEQSVVRDDQLRRTILTSPVRGLVKRIKVGTLGGVVPGGGTIMEIVPIGPKVLIEARIKPSDIGFVRVGQVAEVRLSAYDYTAYGGLRGKVEYISPDALGDTERTGGPDNTYYRALVRAEDSTLRAGGKPLQVIPGMTGQVEVRTGERSILSFLLRPMLRSQEAFRER
jgi:membrane fusion protein, adhesin transport system